MPAMLWDCAFRVVKDLRYHLAVPVFLYFHSFDDIIACSWSGTRATEQVGK